MRKVFIIILAFGLAISMARFTFAQDCATIQDGTIFASTGETLTTGYDDFGYNYGSHMFNGRYCDFDRVEGGTYCDVDLIMKWNNAWLSNMDCVGDSFLDRHYGYATYQGSGAWLTNHQAGKVEVNGKMRKWTYFIKIVAAPLDAAVDGANWIAADGTVIGPVIWGEFAIIQEVSNDPSAGQHGI